MKFQQIMLNVIKFLVLTLCWGFTQTSSCHLAGNIGLLREDSLQQSLEKFQKRSSTVKTLITVNSDGAPFMGSKESRVTLVEFSDYQCFFCRRHDRQVAPKIIKEYVETGKVKYVFRDFPLDSHPRASLAAVAAHCAGDQNHYWKMNDLLFRYQKALSHNALIKFAKSLGLNNATFQKCVESGKYAKKVLNSRNDGDKAGVDSTPYFFLGLTNRKNSEIIVKIILKGAQPYWVFQNAIESLLID